MRRTAGEPRGVSDAIIHKAAEVRLGEIWDYTVEEWGEEQADVAARMTPSLVKVVGRNGD